MREFKFKAWDKCNERMIESKNILKICMSRLNQVPYLLVYLKKHIEETVEIREQDKYYTNEFQLLQWTGLTDKNGVDIYEGDIIKTEQGSIVEVTWDINKFQCKGYSSRIRYGETQLRHIEFTLRADSNDKRFGVEIIGNIFENPELLKGEL